MQISINDGNGLAMKSVDLDQQVVAIARKPGKLRNVRWGVTLLEQPVCKVDGVRLFRRSRNRTRRAPAAQVEKQRGVFVEPMQPTLAADLSVLLAVSHRYVPQINMMPIDIVIVQAVSAPFAVPATGTSTSLADQDGPLRCRRAAGARARAAKRRALEGLPS